METPVLYFYADRPATASVTVSFPQGLFIEFFPRATVQQVPSYANILSMQQNMLARISWPGVSILPDTAPALPTDRAQSHYYAACETDAAPVRVGGQDEKFLFYRGVAAFCATAGRTVPLPGAPGRADKAPSVNFAPR